MLAQQRNKYLQTTVQTATPQQLLIMLYDGAIRFCRQGIEGIKNGNYSDANTGFLKTQAIINEFIITIDRTSPVAENLLKLYDYFNMRLTEANISKKTEPAEEVLNHLIELKETWYQAAKQFNQSAGQASGSNFAATHSTVV
ncbi:flagellar export chaperone FliS [Paenibacillus sp. FSL H8-0548]|uniref:flagellar export chaperone FliS n=1 Tax=Paenibacillus sp. FSL H8-0548 TaxID=1920422 RepID=UPI00096E3623|nr:flagellar export chaperone FliS [Paenibacillus sp. FSL H8-0548]OMF35828.1 flagellar export chaperone FliS [Paenibacillus sp. FSL H8-0548]